MPFIAIALILAAAIGGGTSVAAQNALPGDALWGFKTAVNEQLQAALAPEGTAQANFDISAIEERMKEAAKLTADGRLNAETQADVEDNFDAHAKSVQEQIAKLQEKGDFADAADVAARFQATVAKHAAALAEAKAHASTNENANAQEALGNLINSVQDTLDEANSISEDADKQEAEHGDNNAEATSSDSGRGQNESEDSAGKTKGTRIQTGTSVQGGAGGIKVDNETGAETAI